MRKKQKVTYSEKRDGDDRELFDIVANLLKQKNGEKFRTLYSDGNFSDYSSQSEADCSMIAFRISADPELKKALGEAVKKLYAYFKHHLVNCYTDRDRNVLPETQFIRSQENKKRYKIYYSAKPTFTDADKRDCSRGGYKCKAPMKDRQSKPVVISHSNDSDFPACCSAHTRKQWPSVAFDSQDRIHHTGTEKLPLFFSGDDDTVQQSHGMYLQEIVPQYYRLCSTGVTSSVSVKAYTIHCPLCGKYMTPISALVDKYYLELYCCRNFHK